MASKVKIGGEISIQYLNKFPDTPTLTLAKKMYADNPTVFPSLNAARSALRYRRGQMGKRGRKNITNRSYMKKAGSRNPFGTLPEGLTTLDEAEPFIINGKKSLILADAHVPYHDKKALSIALNYGLEQDVDTLVLLGDWSDFYSVSRWEKDPRKRDFQGELDTVIEIFELIREQFKTQSIVYLLGNHEERFDKYLKVKAPELFGFSYLNFETLIEADRFNIQVVRNKRILKIGSLNLIHGHELNVGRGVVPSRTLYLKAKQKSLMGHLHTTTHYSTKKLAGEVVSCWSVGCLCELRPEYAPYNEWNHGFAVVERLKDSNFVVHNKKIIDGEVY